MTTLDIDWSDWSQVRDIYTRTLTPDASEEEGDWVEGDSPTTVIIPPDWGRVRRDISNWTDKDTPS